ncbi:MAG: M3 family oligoendopeptidase [Chloroflexi bacterium]|nr:M3 family oligoendopeptidase [Chloroflexota bacterium]
MASTLPHWDMSVVFPGLDSPEYAAAYAANVKAVDELAALFDAQGIAKLETVLHIEQTVAAFELAASALNRTLEGIITQRAYVAAFVTTDSRNALAQKLMSALEQQLVRLSVLSTRFTAWIGSVDVEQLIERSGMARDHAFMLRKAKAKAAHLMSPAEEELAARLDLTGGTAWTKLHGNYSSQIMAPIELDGETRELPMTAIRNLAYGSRREVRRRAYEAELAAWKRAEVPILAALNGVKGETNTLTERRRWADPLEEALFESHIDQATLDAMMGAAREAFPDFRRYLKAKARILGVEALAWFDLFAPVGESSREWPYEEAGKFIVKQFATYSPKLSGLAKRAFDERWIDAEPREGKRGGAFCMWLRKDESRILANYAPVFGEVSTLAHELGHAYHNLAESKRTILQRDTPMTLAETASIFCQTIVQEAVLKEADAQEQLLILESSLQDSCQVVVDITSRFLFERGVFARRKQSELSAQELNELMLDAQRQTYGDGLDPRYLHPYMWAVKPHYYGSSFYNYPYMFGLLFGLGLYAQYRMDPEGFKAGYDELLASTGMGQAAELAARFGIDTRSAAFWKASLDVIRKDIDRFESLAGGLA